MGSQEMTGSMGWEAATGWRAATDGTSSAAASARPPDRRPRPRHHAGRIRAGHLPLRRQGRRRRDGGTAVRRDPRLLVRRRARSPGRGHPELRRLWQPLAGAGRVRHLAGRRQHLRHVEHLRQLPRRRAERASPAIPSARYAGTRTTTWRTSTPPGASPPARPRAGKIEVAEDADWFQITLREDRLYTFDLRGAADGGGTLPDAFVNLYDAEGNFVAGSFEELAVPRRERRDLLCRGDRVRRHRHLPAGRDLAGLCRRLRRRRQHHRPRSRPGETRYRRVRHPFDQDWFRIDLAAGETYDDHLAGRDPRFAGRPREADRFRTGNEIDFSHDVLVHTAAGGRTPTSSPSTTAIGTHRNLRSSASSC